MRHSILFLAVGLVAVGLGACDMGTQKVSSTNPTVTYEFDQDDPSKAANMAAEYCRQYGQSARQLSTSERDGINRVTYECI